MRAHGFRDREEAGKKLASALEKYAGQPDVLVLGLPRGGVPVALEVARHLPAPLDVFVVRKLGTPGQPELAMGALASGGIRVLNHDVLALIGDSERVVDAACERERAEMARREMLYRGDRPPLDVRGRICIVVDDGLATGATMRAAVEALRQADAARVVAAVPVGARSSCEEIARVADEFVCVLSPSHFGAVGEFYDDFSQTTDDEVRGLLAAAADFPIKPGR